jgi:hypothetical protein
MNLSQSIKALLVAMLGVFALPLVLKPAPEIVGSELVAEAAVTGGQEARSQEVGGSESKQPKIEQIVINETPPAKQPEVDPAPSPQPLVPPTGCCPECTCDVCTCEYPGQCLLRKAGKHILWIRDPNTKAWRGYASPQCKDVREIDPNYQLPTYGAMQQLMPPKAGKKVAPRRTQPRGGCSGGRCSVN